MTRKHRNRLTAHGGFESDYNVVMDRFSVDNGNGRGSLAEWQAFGFDAHSFVASPDELFMDPADFDYHLLPNRPAINQGSLQPSVTTEFEGQLRPFGSSYDIGADETMILPYDIYLPTILYSG